MNDAATLSLLFRIGNAERQLENLEAPAEILDRIAKDIVATEGGNTPARAMEELHRERDE